jgi:hypothetical protein
MDGFAPKHVYFVTEDINTRVPSVYELIWCFIYKYTFYVVK